MLQNTTTFDCVREDLYGHQSLWGKWLQAQYLIVFILLEVSER